MQLAVTMASAYVLLVPGYADGLLQAFEDSSEVTLTMHEPAMTFTKQVLNPPLNIPPPEVDAGDAIKFRVQAANNLGSAATAHNVRVEVDLGGTLMEPPSKFPSELCKQSCTGFTASFNASTNTIVFYTEAVAANGLFVVDWSNTVKETVAPNDNIYSVGASLVHYDGAASTIDGRQGVLPAPLPSNGVVVGKVGAAELMFVFSATSVAATVGLNVTVHEQVELAATVTLPEGRSSVTLVFDLPTAVVDGAATLLVEDVQVVTLVVGAGISAESIDIAAPAITILEVDTGVFRAAATVSIGTIWNVPDGVDGVEGDSVTIGLQYRVRDTALVQHGTIIPMGTAELVVPNSTPVVAELEVPAYADGIAELVVTLPNLTMTHTHTPGQATPDAGDMVRFSATVEHSDVNENWSDCENQWTLVFRQTAGTYRTQELWKSVNVNNPAHPNYSILSELETFRRTTGEFEFKQVWPNRRDNGKNYNHWSQTSNPVTRSTSGVDGYKAIDVSFAGQNGGKGLEFNTAGSSLLDGSVDSGTWWYAIGSTSDFSGGIPGPGDGAESAVELYVHECVASDPPDATAFDLVATASPHWLIDVDVDTVVCTPECNSVYIDEALGNKLVMELDALAPGEEWSLEWYGRLREGTKTGQWSVQALELAFDSAGTTGGTIEFPGRVFDKDTDEQNLRKTTSITRKHPRVTVAAKNSSIGLTDLAHVTPGEAVLFEVLAEFPESQEEYAVVVDFRELDAERVGHLDDGERHYEVISGVMTGYTDLDIGKEVYANLPATISEDMMVATFSLGTLKNTNVTIDTTEFATMRFEVLAVLKAERHIGNDRAPNSCPNVRARVEYQWNLGKHQKKDTCLTVVEPVLTASDDAHLLDAGDIKTFGMVMEHQTGAANGANAAYELTAMQSFNKQLKIDPTTIFACLYEGRAIEPVADLTPETCENRNGVQIETEFATSGDGAQTGGNVTLFIGSLAKDQKLHLVAEATMVAELVPGDTFGNVVTAAFRSTPDGQADMIVGSNTAETIDYTHTSGRDYEATFYDFPIDVTPPTVVVSLEPGTSTDGVTRDPEMTVGEEAVIVVESVIPEGVTSLWISLVVPPGVAIVDENVRWVGDSFANPQVTAPWSSLPATDADANDPAAVFCDHGDYDWCFGKDGYDGPSLVGLWLYDNEATGETVLILNQGVIANIPNNTENENDKITFEARIQITDVVSNKGTGGGTLRTLAANLLYAEHSRSVQHTVDITVVEPALQTVVQQINPIGLVDGQDTVTLTATVSHGDASRAPAYDGTTVINVPPELILQHETISVSSPDNCNTTVTFFGVGKYADEDGSGEGGEEVVYGELLSDLAGVQNFTVSWTNLDSAADVLVITYSGIVIDTIRPNQVLPQPVTTEYSTMPEGDDRQDSDARFYVGADGDYAWAAGSCDVAMHVPTVTIELISTSLADTTANTLAVAETSVHRVTLWLPESESQFNSGLLYTPGMGCRNVTVTFIGASIVNSMLTVGDRIECTNYGSTNPRGDTTLAFGEIWNVPDNVNDVNDMIAFEVEGQALPQANIIRQGRTRGVTAEFAAENVEASSTGSASTSINIAEPSMRATSTLRAEGGRQYDAGDVVLFDLVVEHINNRATSSFDVEIEATLGNHLEIIAVSSAVGSTALVEANWSVTDDLASVAWNVSELLRPDAFTATITARLLLSMPPQFHLHGAPVCTVDASFDSYPLSVPAATPVGQEAVLPETTGRDYTATGVSEKVQIDAVTVSLGIDESSVFTTTGSELVVHEVIKLEAVVTVPEGTTRIAVAFADLPASLVPIEAQVDAIGGTSDGGLVCEHANGTATIEDAAVVLFDFGKCVNVPTGAQDSLDTITLHIRATVKDLEAAVAAFTHWYTAEGVKVTYAIALVDTQDPEEEVVTRTTQDDLAVTVFEPGLSADIVLDSSRQPAADAGDAVDFEVTVFPTPASSATAYETVVTVTLGDYLQINADSFDNVGDFGNVIPEVSEDGSTAVWTLGSVDSGENALVAVSGSGFHTRYGAQCECPDGSQFYVGDYGNSDTNDKCAPACFGVGAVLSQPCTQGGFKGGNLQGNNAVRCASAADLASATTFFKLNFSAHLKQTVPSGAVGVEATVDIAWRSVPADHWPVTESLSLLGRSYAATSTTAEVAVATVEAWQVDVASTSDPLTTSSALPLGIAVGEQFTLVASMTVPEVTVAINRISVSGPENSVIRILSYTVEHGANIRGCEPQNETLPGASRDAAYTGVSVFGICRNSGGDLSRLNGLPDANHVLDGDDQITLTVVAQLMDVAEVVVHGEQFPFRIAAELSDGALDNFVTLDVVSTIDVVEPVMDLTLADPTDQHLEHGDDIGWSFNVTHTFGHKVSVLIDLPQLVIYDTLAVATSSETGIVPVNSVEYSIKEHTILVTFATVSSSAGMDVLTFDVLAQIKESAPPGAELDCSVAVSFQSAPAMTNDLADTVRVVNNAPMPFQTVYVSHFACDAKVRSTSEGGTANPVVTVGEGVVLEWECTLRGGGPLVLRWNTMDGNAGIYPGHGAVAVVSDIGSHVTVNGSSAELTVPITMVQEDAETGLKEWTATFPAILNTHIVPLSETGADSLTLTVGLSAVGRDLPPLGTDAADLPTLTTSQAVSIETGLELDFADHGAPFAPAFVLHVPLLTLNANVTTSNVSLEAGEDVTFTVAVDSDAANGATAAHNIRVQIPSKYYTNLRVIEALQTTAAGEEISLELVAEEEGGLAGGDYTGFVVHTLEPGAGFTFEIQGTATSDLPHGPGDLKHFVLATYDTLASTSTAVTSRFAATHSPVLTVVQLDEITCDLVVELLNDLANGDGEDVHNASSSSSDNDFVMATVGEVMQLNVDVVLPAGRSDNVTVSYYLPEAAMGFVQDAHAAGNETMAVVGLPSEAYVFSSFVDYDASDFVTLSDTTVEISTVPAAETGGGSSRLQLVVTFGTVKFAPGKRGAERGALTVSVFAAFSAIGAARNADEYALSAAIGRDGYVPIESPTRRVVVLEPELVHTVHTSTPLADAGDAVEFVQTVAHTLASSDAATDVQVQFEIHPFFIVSNCDFAGSRNGDVVYSGVCTIEQRMDGRPSIVSAETSSLPIDQVLTLVVQATATIATQAGVNIAPNSRLLHYRSDGALPVARVYPTHSLQPEMHTRSPIVERFDVSAASRKTARARDDGVESVWPGALVDLAITVSIPEGTTDDFAVCVELPSEVILVGSTLEQEPDSDIGQGVTTFGRSCEDAGDANDAGESSLVGDEDVLPSAMHAVWLRFPSQIIVTEAINQTAVNTAEVTFTAAAIVSRGPSASEGQHRAGRAADNAAAAAATGSLAAVRTVVVTKNTRYSEVAVRELHVEAPKLALSFGPILSNTTQENMNTSYRIVTLPFTIAHDDDSMVPADLWSILPSFNTTLGNYTLSFETTAGNTESLRSLGGSVSGIVTALVHYPGDGPVCFGMDVEYSSPNASASVREAAAASGAVLQVHPLQHSEQINCSVMVRDYDGSAAKKGLSSGGIAGLIFAALAMTMLVVLALLYQHKKTAKDDVDSQDENDTLNPAFATAAKPKGAMGAVLVGALPPSVLQEKGDRLWTDFRRCVSFDAMYFGNSLMALDDDMLVKVYQLLAVKCPQRKLFTPLRSVGAKFREQTLPTADPDADDKTANDVVDFIHCALADVLVERAVDLSTLLMERAKAAGKDGADDSEIEEAIYAMVNENPANNPFLQDGEAGYGKMLNPYAAILDEPDYADPEYYQLEDDAEALYAFATGNLGGGGGGNDPIYALGSGANDPIYAMGNNPNAVDPVYALGNVGNSDPVYALGNMGSSNDPVYAMGNNNSDTGPIYAMGNMGNNDPVYAMGNMGDNAGIQESDVDALYSIATAGGGGLDSSDGSATYSMATMTQGGRGSSEVNNAAAIYEMASEEAQAILDGVATYEVATNENDTYATATAVEAGSGGGGMVGGTYATTAPPSDGHYATSSIFNMKSSIRSRGGGSLRRSSIDADAAYAIANVVAHDEPQHSNFGRGLPSLGTSIRSRGGSSGGSLRRASYVAEPARVSSVSSSRSGSAGMSRAVSIKPMTAAQRRRHEHRMKSSGGDGDSDGDSLGGTLSRRSRRPSGAAETFHFATLKRSPKKGSGLRPINSDVDMTFLDSAAAAVASNAASSQPTTHLTTAGSTPSSNRDSNMTAWSPESSEHEEDFPLGAGVASSRLSQRRTSNFSVHSFAEV